MFPGIPPTGRRAECATVAIVKRRDGKVFGEHIYWHHASVLVQPGLLDASTLPAAGVETALKLVNSCIPSNLLMQRADKMKNGGEEGI
jgi:carboxymethylenebutenolidase